MSSGYSFCEQIDLHVKERIAAEDAQRQRRTAAEILRRFTDQPGVILADEVGMGKTFVALATAISVALQNQEQRPVVVMVPPALKDKWPRDFEAFREKCLPLELAETIRCGRAERAVEFLKLLDDPIERRSTVIFLSHGAMSRGLIDKWMILALICQSLHRRHHVGEIRDALSRFLGDLLEARSIEQRDPEIWRKLLSTPPGRWLEILGPLEIATDDPVPAAVLETLPSMDTSEILYAMQDVPRKASKNYWERIKGARIRIRQEARAVWKECLPRLNLNLPLLILDEAHHLKNPKTDLASLFQTRDSSEDVDEVSKGCLAGVFERMLFLTATPFQLGHGELCSVLDRFDGIDWNSPSAPTMSRDVFQQRRLDLRGALDSAQETALSLDYAWGRLRQTDLRVADQAFDNVSAWWNAATQSSDLTPAAADVMTSYDNTLQKMKHAEQELQQWVIRHLKPRNLPIEDKVISRRQRLVGRAIETGQADGEESGIAVAGDALLPFLLAVRASTHRPDARPLFAEGLASSYEAFLHTRQNNARKEEQHGVTVDSDDVVAESSSEVHDDNWYLHQLDALIPHGVASEMLHPKVSATVRRVVNIWLRGEKVVVFCHYIATGRVLRQKISDAIQVEIVRQGAQKLGIAPAAVQESLDGLGRKFFDEDSRIRKACDAESLRLLSDYPVLAAYQTQLTEIIRRNLRTPSFLVRYFPLTSSELAVEDLERAFNTQDDSELSLRYLLSQFLDFLANRCGDDERGKYIEAVGRIQTGRRAGSRIESQFDDDELQGASADRLLPNVRLVNGSCRSETRQRLMLTFNTPFYPEVLVASSVMAEGVDLHLNCRYMLHHDLCWNPSTLEQRTGRIDRIGAKAEKAGKSIQVYLPYIAETQDEKMYRVVTDRERWFNVVMGEDYQVDLRTTDRLAERIPFPEVAAGPLAFQLDVQ